MKRLSSATLAAILLVCLSASSAWATTTITPSTTSDDLTNNGNCTLREAVQAANTDTAVDQCPAGNFIDEIQLGTGTYDLTITGARENGNQTGDLDVTGSLTIQGNGSGATTIDAHSNDRAIDVMANAGTARVESLTITNGAAAVAPSLILGGAGESGGAIRSLSSLILGDVSVTNSHAGDGRTTSDVIVPGAAGTNGGDGGGVWSDHTTKITGGSFVSDHAGAGSGGDGGDSASAGSGNPGHSAGDGGPGGNGGAIALAGGADVLITGTTFTNDHAGVGGAGGDGGAGGSNSGGTGGDGGAAGNGGAAGSGGAVSATGPATLTGITTDTTVAGLGGNAGKGGSGGSGDTPAHNGQQGTNGNGGAGGAGGAISGGAGALTISGATLSRAFATAGGAGPHDVVATAQGAVPGAGGRGGAISGGTITVSHTVISTAAGGRGGTAATTFGAKPPSAGAGGSGGGVDGSTVTLSDTTISGASAGQGGFGSNTVVASVGDGGAGGGGGAVHATGTASLTDVTLDQDAGGVGGVAGSRAAGNASTRGGAGGAGGGLLAEQGGTLSNVTLDSDTAGAGGPGSDNDVGGNGGEGGGIHAAGALALVHVTVSENNPGAAGPAVSATSPPGQPGVAGGIFGPAQVSDSVVAGNGGAQCSGTTNGSGNVSFPDSSCGGVNADPKLEALADNGGLTKTLLLGAGSSALDTIAAGGSDCTGTDQRGVPRPQGAACDSGAVEAANPALSADPTSADFGTVAQGGTSTRTITIHTTFDPLKPQASLTGPDASTFALSSDGCSSTALAPAGTCTVQVTLNGAGAPGARSATLHIAHDAAGPPIDVPLTGSVIDTTPPTLSGLTLTHKTFAVAKRKPPPKGTTVRFNLSEAASVTFTVTQRRPGRRKGKRCVAPTRKLRHAKHCPRTARLGSFTRSENAGAAIVSFNGRLRGSALRPGSYRLTLSPTDLAGNHGSPHSVKFTIVKR